MATISLRPRGIGLATAAVVLVMAAVPSLVPSPAAASTSITTAVCGTWALQQASTPSDLAGNRSDIDAALALPGVVGLSLRFPWEAVDTDFTLLDNGLAIARARGKALSIRFMAGRWTPDRVFSAGSPYYQLASGEKVPTPFFPNGSPNTVFEAAYDQFVGRLASWARANGVRLLHLAWYGQDWAELNHGTQVRSQPGYTQDAWLAAHKRLIDIGARYAGADLAVELPLSGYGPLSDGQSAALADEVVAAVGAGSDRFFVQANGWGPNGDWGAPDPTVEAALDQIWQKPVRRGQQAIQPNDYDWTRMYGYLYANDADYAEVYLPSFGLASGPQLAAEAKRFSDTQCGSHVTLLGQYPQFSTPGINQFRAIGSAATVPLFNAVGDLYSESALFGCTLQSADLGTCNPAADDPATDSLDNYSRNEFQNGTALPADVAIGELCAGGPGGGFPVDLVRATRAPAATDNCPGARGLEFARDSVVGLTFPFQNRRAVACTTGSCGATQIGPVASGWRPGDPFGGPYSGVVFNNVDNTPSPVLGGKSLAYEIYCDTSGGRRITDWGQLTDAAVDPTTGKSKGSEGIGAPIGVTIQLPRVDPGPGTYSTWKSFVGCDPNTRNPAGRVLAESNAPQLAEAAADGNPTDSIAAANQIARSLYYVSYGAAQAQPYTYSAGGVSGILTKINGVSASPLVELNRSIATARGLYLIYRSDALRGSVAGFLNWVCDPDPSEVHHGVDVRTGVNYSDEVTNAITTSFVFPRVPCAVDTAGNPVAPLTAAMVDDPGR